MKGNWWKKGMLGLAVMCVTAGGAMTVMAKIPSDLWAYSLATDEEGNIIYDFKEVEVTLPADWNGKYGIMTEEDCVAFYHLASRNAMQAVGWTGGWLFDICYSQDYEFTQYLPNYYIVGSGAEGVYYVTLPTDVQGYPDDDAIWNEWVDISSDVEWIRDNVVVTSPGEGIVNDNNVVNLNNISSDGEYILADSSVRYLKASELDGMNADELQMAINEIYARHHRKFVTQSIQAYFNSKSWYSGTVEADAFDPNVMNQYEGKNIALMLQCMNSISGSVQTSSASSSGAASGTIMHVTADMNIRSGASSQTLILGVVPKGNGVTVTGSAVNGWVPVKYEGIQGYIYQDYLI